MKNNLRDKFTKLRQKYREKINGKEKSEIMNIKLNSYFFKDYHLKKESDNSNNDSNEINNSNNSNPNNIKNIKGDYMERLRHYYKLKKDRVHHKIHLVQDFYQKRLDEKENTKMLKSVVKTSLLSSFALLNMYIIIRQKRFYFSLFSLSIIGFLGINMFIQYKLNQRYKRRIQDIGKNE